MPLEATVVCVDNSEFTRNGDFSPSRFQAQIDAVSLICGAKINANPESTVGVMSVGGKNTEVQCALTTDMGKILAALHRIKISGEMNFSDGIQVAQLALKHRQNKKQEQRIVIFIASPVADSEADLKKLGLRLKKNKVAVDIVNFGEEAANTIKLEAFVAAVNNGDNSHLITVPPGPHILSDLIRTSSIVGGGGGAEAGGDFGEFGGVDPSIDPELAEALRLSLQETQAATQPPAPKPATTTSTTQPAQVQSPTASGEEPLDIDMAEADEEEDEEGDEADLLQQALSMSMGRQGEAGDVDMSELSEDEQMALAMQMSMQGDAPKPAETKPAAPAPAPAAQPPAPAGDEPAPEDLQAILANLPGVDPNSPEVKALLESLKKKDDK